MQKIKHRIFEIIQSADDDDKASKIFDLFIILELLVFSAIVFILWRILKKYGVKRFREINV